MTPIDTPDMVEATRLATEGARSIGQDTVARTRDGAEQAADAIRSLWIGTPPHTDVWMSFVWCGVFIVVFAPLAVARYRRVAAT